jgi:hypothetical protein
MINYEPAAVKKLLKDIKILFVDDNETNFEVEDSQELLELLKKRKKELYQTQTQLKHLQQDLNSSEGYTVSSQRIRE